MGNDKREEGKDMMTEYERQRLLRIRENRARLEALGLPALAAAAASSGVSLKQQDRVYKRKNNKKQQKKKDEDDDDEEEEEYQPSDDDDDDDDDDDEDEEEEEERSSEEKVAPSSSSSSRRKGKSSNSSHEVNLSKASSLKRRRKDGDSFDNDDDLALAQAIALSMGEPVESENGRAEIQIKADQIKKSNTTTKELKRTNKKLSKSRIQLTEDEVIGFFFSFDEVGKGYITAYDIEKMAISHDFTWTDGEIAKMVRCFDSDGDRKLNLEDFRSIVSRCHMLQGSG